LPASLQGKADPCSRIAFFPVNGAVPLMCADYTLILWGFGNIGIFNDWLYLPERVIAGKMSFGYTVDASGCWLALFSDWLHGARWKIEDGRN
jgi:hypothetical protein